MNAIALNTTVSQLVAEQPARSRFFETLGIDYCCGGNRAFCDACKAKKIDPEKTMNDLMIFSEVEPEVGLDWDTVTLTALCHYIKQTHHEYLRQSLPRLTKLIDKINLAHGARIPGIDRLKFAFAGFRYDLEAHLAYEEVNLFPLCRKCDDLTAYSPPSIASLRHKTSIPKPGAKRDRGFLPTSYDDDGLTAEGLAEAAFSLTDLVIGASEPGSAANLTQQIRTLVAEHDQLSQDLAALRAVAGDLTLQASTCNTYRAALQALDELDFDLCRHFHLENTVLFPRAIANEDAFLSKLCVKSAASPINYSYCGDNI